MFAYTYKNTNISIGIVLTELLIVMAVSLIVLSMLMQMYLSIQHTYQLQNALQRIAYNAKAASAILYSAVRHAGYIGCARLNADFNVSAWQSYSLTAYNKLVINNQTLTVRYIGAPFLTLSKQENNILYLQDHINYSTNDYLVIADCKHAEIFKAKKIVQSKNNHLIITEKNLANHYDSYAEIGLLVINQFYIASTSRKHPDGSRISSLFVKDILGRQIELVEDIEKMKILYWAKNNPNSSNNNGISVMLDLIALPLKKSWYIDSAYQE